MAVSVASKRAPASISALMISYGAFVLLGMPDGMLGVAWPSMQETFGVSLDTFGILLLSGTIAYMLMSAVSGRFITKWSLGVFLVVGVIFRAAGILGYAVAAVVPSWTLLLMLNFINGIGTGAIDTGFNTYVATNHSAGRLSWLHACFGLGATISPLIMTAILEMDQSWTMGYVLLAALQGVLILVVFGGMRHWRLGRTDNGDGEAVEVTPASPWATLRHPIVLISVATFFIYTGLEVTGGNWSYTLMTEGRGISTATAGTWISIYWGSLTFGRILTGMIVDRLGPTFILRISMFGAVIGAIMITINIVGMQAITFAGLALLGFALAAFFPTMIAVTPQRFGIEHAANAIGFQIGAAGLGFSFLPGVAGVLADRIGLEVIGPLMLIAGVVQWVFFEISFRAAPIRNGQLRRQS